MWGVGQLSVNHVGQFCLDFIQTSPVKFNINYPESLSAGLLFLRLFFGWFYVIIPHYFILAFYDIAAFFVIFIAWWAVLFTGKYPEGMFRFVEGRLRWYMRVYAYIHFMTDQYPPFTGKPYPPKYDALQLEIEHPESLSRGLLLLRLFFALFYVVIPHGILLYCYTAASLFVDFIAWWVILFTGKYPKTMFKFNEGLLRWSLRLNAYMTFMTDQYPPFDGDECLESEGRGD